MSQRSVDVNRVWTRVQGCIIWTSLMVSALCSGCGAGHQGVSPVPTECPEERVVHPSVAMIERDSGGLHCTAWAYSARRVLTNKHCMAGAAKSGTDGLRWKGRRFRLRSWGRADLDYAVLELLPGEPDAVPLPIGGKLGQQETYLIGAGCTGDHTVQVKRLVADHGRRGCVCRGDSGAPVVDAEGRAWGMNRSARKREGSLGSGAHVQGLNQMDLR